MSANVLPLCEGGEFLALNFIKCKKAWVLHFIFLEAQNPRFCKTAVSTRF